MTSLLNGFTSIDYVALVVLILAIIAFLLDLNKKSGYRYKNTLEKLNISRSVSLEFTLRQRIAGYVASLAVIFLISGHSMSGILVVVILSLASEFRTRSILREEFNETSKQSQNSS